MRHRVQRRHRQGRHVLPDDGQEAFARPGDRRAEPAAVRLPGRFGRRQPAAPGRSVPRPRSLRPHLLQPGGHVVAGHRADRGGDGIVHRRRRVRARHVRRIHHRARPGHHFPGRAAPGESGHGRGGQRRRPRRRRRAHAPVRRGRPPRCQRHARAAAGAQRRGPPEPRQAGCAGSGAGARTALRRQRTQRHHSGRHAQALRRARSHRAHRRRLGIRRIQGALRHHPGHRLCPYPWHAGGHRRQQRHSVLGIGAKGAHFIELCAQRKIPWSSCRTSPASWWAASTKTKASRATAPRW